MNNNDSNVGPPWFRDQALDVDGRKCLNGIGSVPAKVMFVDKMPSEQEIWSKRPYTSKQAQFFLSRLKKSGFDNKKARFTYAMRHCPRKVTADEQKWGRNMFLGELAATNPEIVVCFGAEPLKAVVGPSYSWDDVHGAFFKPDSVANCPFLVFATYNLDQVLYGPKWDALFDRDLSEIAKMSEGSPTVPPECLNKVVRTPEEIRSFTDWMLSNGKSMVTLDCEWNGKNWMDPNRYFRTVQIGYRKGRVVTVEVSKEGGKRCYGGDERDIFSELKRLLENENIGIAGHNVIADGEWLLSYGIDIRNNVKYDTMLAEHIIDQNGPFGLETLSMKYTPYGRYSVDVEVWVKRHKNKKLPDTSDLGYGFVPWSMLEKYGYIDVDVLWYIMEKQIPILKSRGCFNPRGVSGEYPSLFETVMRTQRVTYDLEMNGLPVDMAQLDMLTDRYQEARSKELSKVMAMARAAGFDEFNPRSSVHLRKMLFGKLGLNPVKTTDGDDWGDVVGGMGMDSDTDVSASTDKSTLQILEGQHPFVDALLDFRRVDQACKTWLTREKDGEPAGLYKDIWPDGTLKSRFSVLTETGRYRTSSPNSQNWPKKAESYLAKIFGKGNEPPMLRTIVDPNKRRDYIGKGVKMVQLEGDFCQAELFCMANITGDQNMIRTLTTPGLDLHDQTTIGSFGFHMFDENGHEVSEDDLVRLAAELKDQGGAESDEFQHFLKSITYVDAHKNRMTRSEFKSGPRVSGKAISFGVPYGRGAAALALQIKAETGDPRSLEEITAEASKMLDAWKTKLFSRCWEVLTEWKGLVYTQGYIENPWGMRKTAHIRPGDRDPSLERQFGNFPIQSTVSGTVQIAMDQMRSYILERDLPFKMQNQIHDAVMIECPIDMVDECKKMFRDTMAGIRIPLPGGRWFTLDVDIDVYERWGVKM